MSEFINNILGDVYSRQIYIGSDEYGNKLLTRNEVIDQITDSVAEINKNLDILVENSSNLVTLAKDPLFTKIKDAANRTFSLSYGTTDEILSLNGGTDGKTWPTTLAAVEIHIPKYSFSYSDTNSSIAFQKDSEQETIVKLQKITVFDLVGD